MLPRSLLLLGCFVITLSLSAQITSLEVFFGTGTTDVANTISNSTRSGQVLIGFGNGFQLVQNGTTTIRSETMIQSNGAAMAGIEAFVAVGNRSSFYTGLRLGVSFYRYEQAFTSSVRDLSGPIDTIFNSVSEPGSGVGNISICPGSNFSSDGDLAIRGLMLDAGVPIGFRRTFFNGVLSARIQGWLGTPIMISISRPNNAFEATAEGCFALNQERVRFRNGIDANSFLFRAGFGLDLALGHSVKVGLLVEQQLNDTYTTTFSNSFNAVPATARFRPLFGSLVARYQLK